MTTKLLLFVLCAQRAGVVEHLEIVDAVKSMGGMGILAFGGIVTIAFLWG